MRTGKRLISLYPGVNTRIIGPFLLVIIVVAAIGIFIVTNLVAGSIQERFNNQLLDSANSATNTIVDIEREYLSVLRQMAFTEGVADAIINANAENLDVWLRSIAANNRVDELLVFNNSATPLLFLSQIQGEQGLRYENPDTPDISDWQGVERVLSGQADELGDKFVDTRPMENRTVFFFAAPVITTNQRLAGGILLGIRADTLARRVSDQSLSSVTFYDFDGQVFSSTFRRDTEVLTLDEDHVTDLLEQVDSTSPVESIELGGLPYQVIYAPFRLRGEPKGLLSVGLPSNFIVEQSGTSRNVFGALFSVMFAVVAVVGLLIARTITNPIERLVQTTRAIRSGDLKQRVQLRTRDELGELALSFDDMTDTLVHRNQEIESLYGQQVQETARREAMLTSISDAVIVQDMRGNIILSNPAAAQVRTELTAEPDQLAEFDRLCEHPAELSEPQTISLGDFHFSALATPVRMDSGDLLGHVIVFRDITALIQSEKLKDELILQMSHELRTPLSAARGYVDLVKMMESKHITEQGLGFVENAQDHLTILEELLNQVIDVSAMLSNRFTIDIMRCDLVSLLNQVFAKWQPIMQRRNHRLTLHISQEDLEIEADSRRIEELMDHLLRNAYNYTLPGGEVNIHSGTINNYAILSVTDNGVGIDQDEIEKVFERMYRGRSADAGPTDARGLGLGLYIARQIVEAHNGSIALKSERNRGTIVTVTLPMRQPEDE